VKKLVITLLVLVVLALAVDRGGDLVAQHYVATELEATEGLDSTPDVDITGFPFLTQVARNRFDRIDVTVRDLRLGGGDQPELTVTRLDTAFYDVTRSGTQVSSPRARADAVISYADLGDALGIDLAYGDGDDLRVSKTFEIAGQSVDPSITVAPEIADGALGFAAPVVEGLQDDSGVLSQLAGIFDVTLPLSDLPFGVTVEDTRVERDGLHVELSGSDLSYG